MSVCPCLWWVKGHTYMNMIVELHREPVCEAIHVYTFTYDRDAKMSAFTAI